MRKQIGSILLSSFFLAACGGAAVDNTGDGGTGTCLQPPACPVDSVLIGVTVVDAKTGAAVASPSFSVTGYLIDAGIDAAPSCDSVGDAGTCPSWTLELRGDWRFASPALLNQSQEIIVSAVGYDARTFSFTPTPLASTGSCSCPAFSTTPSSITVKLDPDDGSKE